MIAKNKKGKSFGGCVRYVMNESCEVLAAEGVDANDAATITCDFAIQRSGRPEIKQPVGHIAVSFSPEDSARMTSDFMLKLAHEYMAEMGIRNTQYIVVRHHNTDHDHFHIVYNRIDNDLKLISVNNDYRRNIATCKKLKDRYGLTYGTGKERVNRPKLTGADKVKYQIYDEIAANLPKCATYFDLEKRLRQAGITIQYKYLSGAEESPENIQGVSFCKGDYSFKGSAIDRKFSHANLSKALSANLNEAWEKMKDIIIPNIEPMKKEPDTQATPPAISALESTKQSVPEPPKLSEPPRPVNKNPIVAGVRLTNEQLETLQSGGYIFVENLERKDGNGKFSAYLFLNDGKDRVLSCRETPEEFVRYGRYEMRRRDKILVEKGYTTRATVKWYGGGFARPYLWKDNPADPDYKESWSDPRLTKEQLEKQRQELDNRFRRTIPQLKKGLKRRR
jgi:hypothetical protein